MGIQDTRFIERLQFFAGQRLTAPDLQDLEAFNREMRWLHNQSLHQPGIGNGFAVSGKKGERQVTIRPGYALDALGREIVLTETRLEAVPAVAGEDNGDAVFYYLTVSYPDDADLTEAESRQGVCLRSGVVRLREEPEFCWVRLQKDDKGNLQPMNQELQKDLNDGLKIVLAGVEVLNCQLNQDISIAERLRARPSCRPYIAAGLVKPAWDTFEIVESPIYATSQLSFFPFGLEAKVKTSQAGFLTAPFYTAQIVGTRILEWVDGGILIIDGLISLVDPQSTGFTVKVLVIEQVVWPESMLKSFTAPKSRKLPRALTTADEAVLIDHYFSDWRISWMGVEG